MAKIEIKNKKKFVKAVAVFIIVVFIMLIAIIMTKIDNITVVTGEHYSKEEIESYIIKSALDHNAIYLYLKNRYAEQDDIPFVEYVDVELTGINSVKLTVYEKNIIGCIEYMNKYIYFDKDGYFVEQSQEKLDDVTYITGINFNSITLYEKMDVNDDSLFDVILTITKLIEKYEIDTDELNFDSDGAITLYTGDICVLLGKHDTYDEQIAKLVGLLKESEGMSGTFHMENYSDSTDNIIFNKN